MEFKHPQFPRISANEEICFGKPRIIGTRMPVSSILSYLSSGMSMEAFLNEFPTLTKEDVMEAIAFAALMMEDKFLPLDKAS
jgi:uncharacterized protein (DUF433 family)